MRILVLHQNFPGQFGHLVKAWDARPGWQVRGLGRDTAPGLPGFHGLLRYCLAREVRPNQHPYLRQMEEATLHGQAVARAMLQLRREGFVPDAILAHPGWGESLYAKEVFPNARLVHLCEWFYGTKDGDLGFDPEFPVSFDERARVSTWNALHTLNLTHCDVAISPTHWQRSRHPEIFQPKIEVQHEGIATHALRPDPLACLATPSGAVLRHGDPVVTYVARNLEPYRGFHIFIRALRHLQQLHPRCHAVIVGGDGVSYGQRPKEAPNWREQMLREVPLDLTRVHFLGRVPYAAYRQVLQISAAHVHLTYPFVLSWSLLEAIACGAPIVASDTAPVREVLADGITGRLVGFFDPKAVAEAAMETLSAPSEAAMRSQRAARHVQRYSLQDGLAGYDRALGLAGPRTQFPRSVSDPFALSRAEQELLQLLISGHSNDEIARLRHRSPATVRNQVSALYQKLGVSRRAEAIAKAMAIQRSGPGAVTREGAS